MKRITNLLIAMTVMVFTFTSCEDVPSPFGHVSLPGADDDISAIEPSGTGTEADPYNVQAIIDIVKALDADVDTEQTYYVKGIVTNIPEGSNGISTSYNNATFYISDDASGSNSFYVFRCKGLGGGDITDENFLKVGDEVVICSTSWVNYKGNTPETSTGAAYIVSINSNGGGGNDQPSTGNAGTLEKPFTPAEANAFVSALAADQNSAEDYYIKGKIIDITDNNQFGTQYGNCTFYISADGTDSGEKFYVFRTLYLGNVKYTDDSWAKPKAGDEVIICGKVVNYRGNTPETVQNQSYIYSLNGQTSANSGGNGGGNDQPSTGGSISVSATDMGFTAQAVATSYTMTDGTILTFGKGGGSNDPKYYDGNYASVRMYAKNTLTITSSKTITKVVITTTEGHGSTKYNGNDTAYAEGGSTVNIKKNSDTEVEFSGLSAKTVNIVNEHSTASGGTQLRVKAIEITYAQ